VGPVIGPDRRRWPPVGRLVGPRNSGRTCVEARALAAARLARLAGDAIEAPAELQAALQPTPADQAAGNDAQAGVS